MGYVGLFKITVPFLLWCVMLGGVKGELFDDVRCKCVCPNVSSDLISNSDTEHTYSAKFLYMANVPQYKCNCGEIVLPRLKADLKEKGYELCLQCKCKHESKYTGTIKLTLLIVIWICCLLVLFMAFMIIFNPLFMKKIVRNNEEDTSDATSASDDVVNAILRNPLLHTIPYLEYGDDDFDDENDERHE